MMSCNVALCSGFAIWWDIAIWWVPTVHGMFSTRLGSMFCGTQCKLNTARCYWRVRGVTWTTRVRCITIIINCFFYQQKFYAMFSCGDCPRSGFTKKFSHWHVALGVGYALPEQWAGKVLCFTVVVYAGCTNWSRWGMLKSQSCSQHVVWCVSVLLPSTRSCAVLL